MFVLNFIFFVPCCVCLVKIKTKINKFSLQRVTESGVKTRVHKKVDKNLDCCQQSFVAGFIWWKSVVVGCTMYGCVGGGVGYVGVTGAVHFFLKGLL